MRNCKHKHASLILDVTLHLQVKVISSTTIIVLLHLYLTYLLCISKSYQAIKSLIMIIQLNIYGGTGGYLFGVAPAV
jgi:hypothetical protein